MKSICIMGAGGIGKQCIEVAQLMGYKYIFIFDQFKKGKCLGYEITSKAPTYCDDYFIGIGDNKQRKNLHEQFPYFNYTNLIHPKAYVSKYAALGEGNYIGFGTSILQDTKVGNFNIINESSCIAHDCEIGNYNHVSVHGFLAGNVKIGNLNFICGHGVLIPGVKLGNDNILGANSTLIKSFESDNSTLIGSPAKCK